MFSERNRTILKFNGLYQWYWVVLFQLKFDYIYLIGYMMIQDPWKIPVSGFQINCNCLQKISIFNKNEYPGYTSI